MNLLYRTGPGFQLHQGDCREVLASLPDSSVDLIFADPPYRLSSGGFTCRSGRAVPVYKGAWDVSDGFRADYRFTLSWLQACSRVLKDSGTIWVSGTYHSIFMVGTALQKTGFRILNDIVWFKPNASPNLGCRCFTASHETLIWASKGRQARYIFNYRDVVALNGGKQMRSVWTIPVTAASEKQFGRHPTQKPLELLSRVVLSTSSPGDVVLDPFMGSGTTGVAALRHQRRFIGIELEPDYLAIGLRRLSSTSCSGSAVQEQLPLDREY